MLASLPINRYGLLLEALFKCGLANCGQMVLRGQLSFLYLLKRSRSVFARGPLILPLEVGPYAALSNGTRRHHLLANHVMVP